jgi:hypothetical protein
MATMFGWCRLAAETASARNRLTKSGFELGPNSHHLDRDHAVEAALPGAIDHAHAAAADFLQQLVVAEPIRGFRVDDCA